MNALTATTRRRGLVHLSAIAGTLILLLPARASADGSLSFAQTPHRTITAGDPFSSMNRGIDWIVPHPTATVGGFPIAQPNAPQGIQIETWSTATSLNFKFTFDDASRTRFIPQVNGQPDCNAVPAPCTDTLEVGDRIIIELNPNNANSLGLEADNVRFEVTLKGGAVDATQTGKRIPNLVTGNWRALTPLPSI